MESLNINKRNLVFGDRARTNVLKDPEQRALMFFCRWMPEWVTPDMLTILGLIGSVIVLIGLLLSVASPYFLFLSIIGFAVQWFGDSLDGRVAYYRNRPRKWYGFSLDLCMDWISTVLIGIGFYFYVPADFQIFVFLFVAAYGWSMVLALLKYKVTGAYAIDSGVLGPTEVRVILCLVLLAEIIFPSSIQLLVIALTAILVLVNIFDFFKLLRIGDQYDRAKNGELPEIE